MKKKEKKIIHRKTLSLREKFLIKIAFKRFGFEDFVNWVYNNKELTDLEKENIINYCERLK